MENQKYPKEGYRFELYENQYDITAIIGNNIRFSSVVGGKIHNISVQEFLSKIESQGIKYIETPHYPLLDKDNYALVNRKKRYLEATLLLKNKFSNHAVQLVIKDIATTINDPKPPCSRTVIRWMKKFSKDESFLNDFKPNSGNCSLRFSPEVENLITHGINEYFLKPREKRSAKDVIAYIENEALNMRLYDHLPTLRTLQRRILALDPYQVYRHKKGVRTANQHFQAAGKKLNSPFLMNKVEIDSHLLDVIVLDDNTLEPIGRPILTCAIDVFSRCIVGWDLSVLPPNIDNTINLLKDMFTRPKKNLPGGIPSYIIPDNGVEFKNNILSHICENRKITVLPSQKYNPNNKPHIERFFRTLTFSFSQKLKGTTFSNPTSRGEYNSKNNANLTLSDLKALLHEWIESIYHQSPHSGIDNRVPTIFWKESVKHTPVLSMSEDEVNILLRIPMERTVNNGRIQVNYLTYYSHCLVRDNLNKKKVTILIDRTNLAKIYVRDPDDKNSFIPADSTNPSYTENLSLYEHVSIQEEKKNISRKDLQALGDKADILARWNLLVRIQESYAANKKLKKLKLDTPSKIKNLINHFSNSVVTYNQVNGSSTTHQESEIVDEYITLSTLNHNEPTTNAPPKSDDDEDSTYESMSI